MRRYSRRALRLFVVVGLLVLGVPGLQAAAAEAPPSPVNPGLLAAAGGTGSVAPTALPDPGASPSASPLPSHLPIAPSAAAWNNSSDCRQRLADYLSYYGRILPTDVVHTEQSPCYIGHDEPELNFVSNGSYSGSRVQFVIDLPSAGTNTASAFATMWVGMWLAGVPCSYRGQSYLEVQLNPPYNVLGLAPNPNWTLQAPVWDLVPPGSCDPQCQNDTAFATIGGLPYCEDDAAISGVGTYSSTGWGNFAPGDELTVAIVGEVGGTSGLSVYVNDSTNPASSLQWTYSAAVTADGRPLTPFYNASAWTASGWGYGLNVAATWENCPEPVGYDYPSPCNSYNGPAVDAVQVPTFRSASYWNASTLSYSNPFPWTATTSSAGGCSGYAAPCQDFTTFGGTGFYPFWSLHAFGGKAWWMYGGTAPHEVNRWGGSAGEFSPLGFVPVYLDPTSIASVENTTVGNTFSLTAAVADPNGVQRVEMSAYFCHSSSTPQVQTQSAVLTISPWDTAEEGNWSTTFGTGGYTGTLYYWVRAESSAGVWSDPVSGSAAITGLTSCSFTAPAAPTFSASNVTAVGGGYALTWNDTSPGITDYTVWFNQTPGGTPFSADAGTATSLVADLGAANATFSIWVTATTADGLSASSPSVLGPPTLLPLAAQLLGPTSTVFWVGQATVNFTASAVGGLGPYTYVVTFGDGSTTTVVSNASVLDVSHDYGSYFGNARASVAVTDALGDTTISARQLIQIWATPLGVPQSIAAGDGAVRISWGIPASPAAPVVSFTVYYSENPQWAWAMTEIWPYNFTADGLYLWNTTGTSLTLPVPDGVALYAQVVAWNAHGEGLLPAGSPFLIAVPVPFTVGPILASPGGPAPYVASLSAFVTNGTNDGLVQALYSSGTASVNANVTAGAGGTYVNATLLFTTAGPHLVILHVADSFFSVGIQLATVYVSPGVGPTVTLTPPTANGWFGWPGAAVSLEAQASSGVGPYNFSWQFGDGAGVGGANVSHTYTAPGNYTLVVTATDLSTEGVTTVTQAIHIFALPTIAIATLPGPNGSLSVEFGALVSGGSGAPQITWAFGDGGTATGLSVVHDYASPGTYTVNATATDPTGKTGSDSIRLTVSGAGGGGAGGGTFLGVGASTLGVLFLGVAVLALLFLVGLIYFWSRARRPVLVLAPEPVSSAPEPPSPPPEPPR